MEEKKVKKEKCIHEGHRARLVEVAKNVGLDNLSSYQVMEFFLTYIFPRGDMNPLAHRLLNEFETFTNVIDASERDLMRVKGINQRSARMISMFGELFFYYTTARMGRKPIVASRAELLDVVEDHLRFRNTENLLLLALSPVNIITHKRRIDKHSSMEVGTSMLDITDFLSSSKPASLVVAHCHPFGTSEPSEADDESFKKIDELCNQCGVNLMDSLILGEDGVFSQRDGRLVRTYYDIDELKEALVSVGRAQ